MDEELLERLMRERVHPFLHGLLALRFGDDWYHDADLRAAWEALDVQARQLVVDACTVRSVH